MKFIKTSEGKLGKKGKKRILAHARGSCTNVPFRYIRPWKIEINFKLSTKLADVLEKLWNAKKKYNENNLK